MNVPTLGLPRAPRNGRAALTAVLAYRLLVVFVFLVVFVYPMDAQAKKPQCMDGLDNDGDGKTDYTSDPGCSAKNDQDETDPTSPPPSPSPSPSPSPPPSSDSACPSGTTDVTKASSPAVPNDGKPDQDAIQSQINAASSGTTLCFPSGTYDITDRIVPNTGVSGITLQGGQGATIKRSPSSAHNMMLYLNGVSNFAIKGLSFDGGASASTPFDQQNHAIAFWGGSNVTVDGNTFSNLMGDGVVLLAHNSGTDCPVGATVSNNTMNGSGIGRNGISSVCGSGHNIIGNTITDWSRGDMPGGIDLEPDVGTQSLNDVLVEGNTIGFSGPTQEPLSTWWKSGIHSALNYTGARSSNVTIRGNDISGKVANGIMISTHPSDVWRVENNTVHDVSSSQAYSGIRNAHGGSHIYSGDTITNIDGGSGYCIALDSWIGGSPQLSNNTTSGCR